MISNFYLWRSACSFTMSCLGRGLKRCKIRCRLFGILSPEKSGKSPEFSLWDLSGNRGSADTPFSAWTQQDIGPVKNLLQQLSEVFFSPVSPNCW